MVTSILWKVHAAATPALESMTREAISWNERKERIKKKGGKIPAVTALLTQKKKAAKVFLQNSAVSEF